MTQLNYEKPVTEEELAKRAEGRERVSLEDVNKAIVEEYYYNPAEIHPLTICVLKLENGFMLVGHSAPAIEENFEQMIGRRLAREQALKQVWQMLGYALKDRLFREAKKED